MSQSLAPPNPAALRAPMSALVWSPLSGVASTTASGAAFFTFAASAAASVPVRTGYSATSSPSCSAREAVEGLEDRVAELVVRVDEDDLGRLLGREELTQHHALVRVARDRAPEGPDLVGGGELRVRRGRRDERDARLGRRREQPFREHGRRRADHDVDALRHEVGERLLGLLRARVARVAVERPRPALRRRRRPR